MRFLVLEFAAVPSWELGPYHTENAKKKVKFLLSKNFTFVVLFHITRKAKLKFLLSKNFTFVRVFLYHTEQNKKKLRAFPKVSNHDHMWAIWWKRVAGREDPSCRKDSLSVTIVDMDAFEINSYDGNEGSGSTMSSSQGEDSLISSAHSPSTQPAVAQSTDEYPSVAVAAEAASAAPTNAASFEG